MTKDLSKTLCELAGMKKKYRFCGGMIGDYYCFDTIEELKLHPQYTKGDCNEIPFFPKIEEIYPNFESPENFVKLLEVYLIYSYDILGINNIVFSESPKDMAIQKQLIKKTISRLDGADKLKQALQATEFKY